MAAVEQAALALLAQRGPREVTVRDVAERAGVNHALVHRHFGTKDELIRTVVARESERIAAETAEVGTADISGVLAVLREHPAYWHVLARTVLDEPEMLAGEQLPAAAAVLAMAVGDEPVVPDVRAAAAVAGSLALGWLVFGRHLATVLQVDDAASFEAAVAAEIGAAMARPRRRAARSGA